MCVVMRSITSHPYMHEVCGETTVKPRDPVMFPCMRDVRHDRMVMRACQRQVELQRIGATVRSRSREGNQLPVSARG